MIHFLSKLDVHGPLFCVLFDSVTIPRFEEELTRQLHTLALDESLALVQERGRSRGGLFRNPYSHFGRPDVRLVPNSRGSGGVSGGDMMSASGGGSHTFHHAPYHHYTSTLNLAHGHAGSMNMMNSHKYQDFPTFRICEVRPPHIEKVSYQQLYYVEPTESFFMLHVSQSIFRRNYFISTRTNMKMSNYHQINYVVFRVQFARSVFIYFIYY